MSPRRPTWILVSGLLVSLALVLSCSLPGRILENVPEILASVEPSAGEEAQEPAPEEAPTETPAPEPLVVTHQGGDFKVHSLDGSLVETRSASGLDYARPNTAQVVGESIYYVDSGDTGMGGVIRRVTSAGAETLDFTAAEAMQTITFAVSADETRIAWTHSGYENTGVVSQLWIANLDGSDAQVVTESDPSDSIDEYFSLEAVRWEAGDLIYAWQVTGIGGYILFFGWSSFYRYYPLDDISTALISASGEAAGPCWYAVSPDGMYAVGGCGEGGMRERDLVLGTDTVFPLMPEQGQQGGAAYSPSGERLAYAIARGNYEDEAGQVLVRMSREEDPIVLSTQTPGFFERVLWVDEGRMVVGYAEGESSAVDLLTLDGARTPIGEGRLIGLMQPAALVTWGDLEVEEVVSNGEISGPGMDVTFRNPGPEDVTATIPCGFTFAPEDADDQRLMVVQPASIVVPAGGEATLTAYVICIDADSSMPDYGATYTMGTMQTGSLLKLAECACTDDLAASSDSFAGSKLMTAGWMISEGMTLAELQETGEVWDPGLEGYEEYVEAMAQAEAEVYGWLERCEIPFP